MTYEQVLEQIESGEIIASSLNWYGEEAVRMIVKAVEKQIPKKPVGVKNHYLPETYDLDYAVAKCPSCGETITFDEYHQPKFCWECGQALDWGMDG